MFKKGCGNDHLFNLPGDVVRLQDTGVRSMQLLRELRAMSFGRSYLDTYPGWGALGVSRMLRWFRVAPGLRFSVAIAARRGRMAIGGQ